MILLRWYWKHVKHHIFGPKPKTWGEVGNHLYSAAVAYLAPYFLYILLLLFVWVYTLIQRVLL